MRFNQYDLDRMKKDVHEYGVSAVLTPEALCLLIADLEELRRASTPPPARPRPMRTHIAFSRLTGPTLTTVTADCRRLATQAQSEYRKHDEREQYWLDEAWEFSQLAEAAEYVLESRKRRK